MRVCNVPNDAQGFAFTTSQRPAWVERVVIAASAIGGTMFQIGAGHLRLMPSQSEAELASFVYARSDFLAVQPSMLGELYRKDGERRFMAGGQGLNGGLDVLVRHFGGTAEETPAPQAVAVAAVPEATFSKISLKKRFEHLALQFINLARQAGVLLENAGLASHRAKVCLCLKISGSPSGLYRKGHVVRPLYDRIPRLVETGFAPRSSVICTRCTRLSLLHKSSTI